MHDRKKDKRDRDYDEQPRKKKLRTIKTDETYGEKFDKRKKHRDFHLDDFR